jgi:hypothetical protein
MNRLNEETLVEGNSIRTAAAHDDRGKKVFATITQSEFDQQHSQMEPVHVRRRGFLIREAAAIRRSAALMRQYCSSSEKGFK